LIVITPVITGVILPVITGSLQRMLDLDPSAEPVIRFQISGEKFCLGTFCVLFLSWYFKLSRSHDHATFTTE